MAKRRSVIPTVKAAKRRLVRRIKALIRPHLYPSGYVSRPRGRSLFDGPGTPIMIYAPQPGSWDADYMSDDLADGPDAVTDTGFVDAGVGGMVETPFEDVPVEDLDTFVGILETFDFVGGIFTREVRS